MLEYKVIDLNTYPRRAHFEYFMTMQSPQTQITANVDVTELRAFCKKEGCSFFLAFLHCVALAADSIPQLRQRIHVNDREKALNGHLCNGEIEIREYAECPTSHTEGCGNELYCYCTLRHHMPWKEYIAKASEAQLKARECGSLEEDDEIEGFYFPTCIPWIHYTEAKHPMTDRFDSNPRISWGRFEEDFRGRLMMPLTLAVHHGLADGIHIGHFYEETEKKMAALVAGEL